MILQTFQSPPQTTSWSTSWRLWHVSHILNIIENLWIDLNRAVPAWQPKNFTKLVAFCLNECAKIPQAWIERLYAGYKIIFKLWYLPRGCYRPCFDHVNYWPCSVPKICPFPFSFWNCKNIFAWNIKEMSSFDICFNFMPFKDQIIF